MSDATGQTKCDGNKQHSTHKMTRHNFSPLRFFSILKTLGAAKENGR
uniref:Uncharacterized protein n=1 Tax=mine drainage metagenome TaxID=410659 RepID=E6QJB9_9ZZZZ